MSERYDALIDQRAALIALPDAIEAGSETSRRILAIDAEMTTIELVEAAEMRAEFERSLLMPIDAGERLARAIAAALGSE